MAAIELSTAGIRMGYAVETTAGTKPTAFTRIHGVKSIPSLSSAPDNLETSTLDIEAGGFRTYIQGLRDSGGALEIRFNESHELHTKWKALHDAYEEGKQANKRTWIEFWIPGMDEAFYFTADVADLGFGGAEVNAVLGNSGYVTPTGEIGWGDAIEPTDAA